MSDKVHTKVALTDGAGRDVGEVDNVPALAQLRPEHLHLPPGGLPDELDQPHAAHCLHTEFTLMCPLLLMLCCDPPPPGKLVCVQSLVSYAVYPGTRCVDI